MVEIIGEYRHLSQSIAHQYGCRHETFTGDGHLFLFESVDIAIHFSLTLLAYWRFRRRSLLAVHHAPELPIRIGCHFGECSQFSDADAWIGRAINLAKRVETSADPDSLFITQTILELIDLPFYCFKGAGLYQLTGDFLEQRPLYRMLSVDQAALAERPDDEMSAEDWFLRGVGRASALSGTKEAECYRRALRLRTNYPEAHNNLAILLKGSGDREGAAEHYHAALLLWPQYPEAHYNYAILLESMDDPVGAIAHYQQAICWRPDYTDARLRYANLLAWQGEIGEAEQQYREAVRLRPGYAEAHNNYAVLLDKRGATPDAEREYREAIRLRSDYAEAHYNYAMQLEASDRVDEAEQHYREALRISPNYAEASNNLAVLLHGKGDLDGAAAHYEAALRLRPRDPETNYNFALVAQARGDADLADQHFRLAREFADEVGKGKQ
jgi:tetratricopeptide (TPR) repeat protein